MKDYLLIIILLISSLSWSQNFDVQHYEINLKVPNSYMTNIEGRTLVDVKFLADNISQVDLMLLALNVDSIFVGNVPQTFTYNDTTIQIQLSNSYQTNDLLELEIYYHGTAHTDSDGWGGILTSSGYFYNLGVSMSADPHNYGRVWYPCVDNFTDKATFLFNITCQDQRTAVCGGTQQNEVDNGDGTKTFTWLLDKETPTYLTSVAIGNYEVYRDTFTAILGQIPVAIYARSNEIANVPASFANLETIFHLYENKFGAYRWDRVGYVGVPFQGGAMEHAENIAYPNSSIDGTLNNEILYAHELSHSWFGNATTCSTAGDMWLNEGWASYCEAIVTEALYGKDAFKTYNRNRHINDLQHIQFDEGGYWPLYNIPTDLTYSSHVYNKGADVVHSLRAHLGDELFFTTISSYLNDHQYQSVSSYDLRDYLTANTPYDLTGFFDSWVFSGGWLQFSVDSFTVTPNSNQFDIQVFMRQKLKGRTEYGVNNRIPIQFLSSTFQRIDTMITVSGEHDSQIFTIPFEPYSVLCDMEEQISDATTDRYEIIKNTGTFSFPKAFFKSTVSQVTDSVLLRVEHNWVGPDDFMVDVDGLDIHPERYWKIDGIFNDDFQANGQFLYTKSSSYHLDNEFITTHVDSIVVLYRPNSGVDWQIIPHTRNGSTSSGYMVIDNLQRGEYAFAIWDAHVNTKTLKKEKVFIIKPNPAHSRVNISFTNNKNMSNKDLAVQVFNINGRLQKTKIINRNKKSINIDLSFLAAGIYFINIGDEMQKIIIE